MKPVRPPGEADAHRSGLPRARRRPARDSRVPGRLAALLREWPRARRGTPGHSGPDGSDTPAAPRQPLEGKVLPPATRPGPAEPREPVGSGKRAQAATPPPGWNAPVPVPPRPAARRGAAALATIGHAATQLASAGAAAARRYPLEATAITLLGLGGLILPFPFWLIGALVAVRSRIWDRSDKWAAFLGPLLFALAGSIVTASVIHAEGNVILIYSHAVRVDFGYLLRAGSVLCAIFLALRLRHGPRQRPPRAAQVPPWRR
jgi:hypothetical protein